MPSLGTKILKPYWQTTDGKSVRLYLGDVLETLRKMPSKSVQMVVTSPPYWALRDYGTGEWVGGKKGCEHSNGFSRNDTKDGGNKGVALNSPGVPAKTYYKEVCGKCGAKRIDQQIGSEATPQEFVSKMVEVFREVHRVLRDDGTCWINMGDTYASSMPNRVDVLNSLLKRSQVTFLDLLPECMSAQAVEIPSQNKRLPKTVFKPLFSFERKRIKQGNNNFSQVSNFFTAPNNRGSRITSDFVRAIVDNTPKVFMNLMDDTSIIFSDLNSSLQPELAVLSVLSSHNHKASFSVKETGKPRTEFPICWHSTWDSFLLASPLKSRIDINVVDYPVSLLNSLTPLACLSGDFIIVEASEKQVTLQSIDGLLRFSVSSIDHLKFLFEDGRIIPYSQLYKESNQIANSEQLGQELGIPNLLKIGLQRDGWICRQSIIWYKPSPMPESCTNRCTKAHEYIFLLTKGQKYFYDADAIREDNVSTYSTNDFLPDSSKDKASASGTSATSASRANRSPDIVSNGRNKRSIWEIDNFPGEFLQWFKDACPDTFEELLKEFSDDNNLDVWKVASRGYEGAHFATFPPDLIEPTILAGTSEYGACVRCGAPWKRVTEKTQLKRDRPNDSVKRTGEEGTGNSCANSVAGVETKTLGWEPTCWCGKGINPTTKVRPCIVLDPFMGSGTTAVVALDKGRWTWGIELNEKYILYNAIPRIEGAIYSRPGLAHLLNRKVEKIDLGEELL